jgi:hypothetical protein
MVRQELLLPDYLLDNWAESLYELGRTTDSGKVRPDMVSLLNIPKPAAKKLRKVVLLEPLSISAEAGSE